MDIQLNEVEVRALGALIEKELTTPEYYPLTLNSLTMACNQKSNRDPVVAFDNKTVLRVVESMRDKNLTMLVTGAAAVWPSTSTRLRGDFSSMRKRWLYCAF